MKTEPKALTGAEEESFKQKLSLVISLSGSTLETSLSVLLYAAAHIGVSNHVDFASVVRSFADIYLSHPQHPRHDEDDEEGDE